MKPAMSSTASSPATTLPTEDPIFQAVRELHGSLPWGHVLDAGTGHTSLSWVVTLESEAWTAVTGETTRARSLDALVRSRQRAQDRILIGNWREAAFLEGETFDVVLADYLLGAVERYAPYFQYEMLQRLYRLTRKRLYLVGLEPYRAPRDAGEQAVCDIAHLRDALHLHNGERYHREFPLEWTRQRLQEVGFRILDERRFPVRYGARFIDAELGLCRQLLQRLPEGKLRQGLQARLVQVEQEALQALGKLGALSGGSDYLIAAEPAD